MTEALPTVRRIPLAPLTRDQQRLAGDPAALAMVSRTAQKLARRYGALVSRETLESEGQLALVLASRLYDPKRGVAFEVFAWRRVRGAMLRDVRHAAERVKFARAAVDGAYQFLATTREEGDVFSDSPEEHRARRQAFSDALLAAMSMELLSEATRAEADAPEEERAARAAYHRLSTAVEEAIPELPPPEPKLLHLHYWADPTLTLEEIGAALKLSYASTRRLHHLALDRLGKRLRTRGLGPALD